MIKEILANKIDIPLDEIKLLAIIVLNVPLSYTFGIIKSCKRINIIHLKFYMVIIGLFSSIYLFGFINTLLLSLSVLFFYYMSKFCATARTTLIISFLALAYLSFFHIYRYWTDYNYNTNSFINILMMQSPRIIYYNWYCYKAKQSKESPDIPIDFYNYFCYLFCFIGILTGPVYSYQEYTQIFKNNSVLRSSTVHIKHLILQVLCVFVLYVVSLIFIPPLSWTLTSDFAQLNIFYRSLALTVLLVVVRFKYYIVWLLADISSAFVGLRDGDADYKSSVKNIHVKNVEMNFSTKKRIENWNITIAKWLRHCFYEPLSTHMGLSKEISSLIVFILSAFWHGFYPAYYVSFILFYISLRTERLFFKSRLRNYIPKLLYHLQMDVGAGAFKFYMWSDTKIYLKNICDIIYVCLALLVGGLCSSKLLPLA